MNAPIKLGARPELTPLSQEISTRYAALPLEQKRDPCLALVRVAVETTRDFMQEHPEGVDEFLRLFLHQPSEVH